MKKLNVLFLILVVALICGTEFNGVGLKGGVSQTNSINVAVLIEDQFSIGEFNGVIEYYQNWGYTITTTGIGTEKICDLGFNVTVDIQLSDLDITEYECLYIPGGYSYVAEIQNEVILNLVRTANSEGVVLAAICAAPAVLAAAGILNGTKVTGHQLVVGHLISAGANYSSANAMVDGNIVTGVPPFYEEFAIATAQALGLYEDNPPTVLNTLLEPLNGSTQSTFTLSIEISDETGISFVVAKIYKNSDGQNTLVRILELKLNGEGRFTCDFTILDPGNYQISLEIEDFYGNTKTLDNIVSFNVTTESTSTTANTPGYEILSFVLGISILAGIYVLHQSKKRKSL
ncbi:MAG: DJ-1/PfpI family protein [Candidatus Hodarchaeota archaeon]